MGGEIRKRSVVHIIKRGNGKTHPLVKMVLIGGAPQTSNTIQSATSPFDEGENQNVSTQPVAASFSTPAIPLFNNPNTTFSFGDSPNNHKSSYESIVSATHSNDSSSGAPFTCTKPSSTSNATAAAFFQSTQPPSNSIPLFGIISSASASTPSGFASFAFHSPNNAYTSSSFSNPTTAPLRSTPFPSQLPFFAVPSNFGDISQATTSASITSTSSLFATTPVASSFGCGLLLPSAQPPTFTFDASSSAMELGESTNPPSMFQHTPPLFRQSTTPFGGGLTVTSVPPPIVHICKRCGDKSFWGQQWGSKVASYTPTLYCDPNPSLLISASAMPCYKDKCHKN